MFFAEMNREVAQAAAAGPSSSSSSSSSNLARESAQAARSAAIQRSNRAVRDGRVARNNQNLPHVLPWDPNRHAKLKRMRFIRHSKECPLCYRIFSSTFNRNRHINSEHSISRSSIQSECDLCYKRFETRQQLNFHLRSHLSARNRVEYVDSLFLNGLHRYKYSYYEPDENELFEDDFHNFLSIGDAADVVYQDMKEILLNRLY